MSTGVIDGCTSVPGFHMCLEDLNLGPQACQVNTIATESSSPQPRICSNE